MKGFVGVTDNDWFAFLSQQPGIDEVNLWQPGGTTRFRRLRQDITDDKNLKKLVLRIMKGLEFVES
ncbi:MAG: hypothetical protein ACETWD_01880 [Desulfatiglandales bacterium]